MRKLIKIKKNLDVIYSSDIEEYLNPDYVYIPIKKNYTILVKKGEEVKIGGLLLENHLNKVLSPVSGKVIDVTRKNVNGKLEPVIIIQNNFEEKEKTYRKKANFKRNKDEIISNLYNFYFKYVASVLETKKINNLVINGIEDEPYMVGQVYMINKYAKEILEMMDIFSKVFEIRNPVIVIKNNDQKNIEKYLSKIGTYPNVNLNLVPDRYLLGKNFFLLEYLNLSPEDTLVIDVKLLLEIYNALMYNKFTYTTCITIAGPSLSRSMVLKVKVGTSFKDIIESRLSLKNDNNLYILNGLMTGYECDFNNAIVTKETLGLIIIPKNEEKEHSCINCGLCYKSCPVKVNPKKVMDTKEVSQNCIDCGICSYVCPSHINLRKFLKGEK